MITVESPGKVNLSLLVSPPRRDGYHPLDSVVQTIEWCDILTFGEVDDSTDHVTVSGADLDPEDNLMVRAVSALREVVPVPSLAINLEKELPMEAGLGGGSSNAAATLLGVSRLADVPDEAVVATAPTLGADVRLFFTGGTLRMTGIGEVIEPLRPLFGFALAIAMPDFGLSSAEVYRRWDEMEGPVGEVVADRDLPPNFRNGMPIRNDLLPAAVALNPELAEFMAEVRSVWGRTVMLTGAGSACFGFFPTLDEAEDAASAVSDFTARAKGVHLRDQGVAIVNRADQQDQE